MYPSMLTFSFCLAGVVLSQIIDPSTVDGATKAQWCSDQKASCPLLCLQIPGATGRPQENDCTTSSLDFSCICSNGQQPNASEYSQTIPYYECTTAATNCVNNCGNSDSACQSACREDRPCGAQSPTRANTSTLSTMAATSMTADSTATDAYTGFGGSPTGGSSDSGAVRQVQTFTVEIGRVYGVAMVAAGVIGGVMLLL